MVFLTATPEPREVLLTFTRFPPPLVTPVRTVSWGDRRIFFLLLASFSPFSYFIVMESHPLVQC